MNASSGSAANLLPEHRVSALFLARYFYFLGRRPISRSNTHYLNKRLAGLKALGARLEDRPHCSLKGVLGQLQRLAAINFQRLYPALREELKGLMQCEIPADVVVSRQPPGREFLRPVRRALVILGPAIGVGDEIITFPIPSWLTKTLPDAEVTVLSAYAGLWNRVAGVAQARTYKSYPEVVDAIRGRGADGHFDLVVMVDFENPSLFPAVCDEAGIERYVEVSMASRSIVAFEARRRRLHRFERSGPYFENYYDNLVGLMSWLGLPATLNDRRCAVLGQRSQRGSSERVVLVSPFSSKHDPIEAYWSQLLASTVVPGEASSTRFVFDTGPNTTTERFAHSLARATKARAPYGVRCEVAQVEGRRILTLEDMFHQMERAHALICVDSYAAHAGPLFGCTTFVLAPKKVESWRVPAAQSYYFDAAAPLSGITAAIRQVLEIRGDLGCRRMAAWQAHARGRVEALVEAADRLSLTLEAAAPIEDLCRSYDDLCRASSAVNEERPWPGALGQLFADRDYGGLLPALPPGSQDDPHASRADLETHLHDKLIRLRNTNLWKLLERITGRAEIPGDKSNDEEGLIKEMLGEPRIDQPQEVLR